MLPFQIARRFLWRSRFQSALIIVGIAIGIGTQVFVGSLINSLQGSLIGTTVGTSPHVTFEAADEGGTIEWPGSLEPELRADAEVTAILPQHLVSVLVRFDDATDPLAGVHGPSLARRSDVATRWRSIAEDDAGMLRTS